jgi:hypothetical protein
MRACVAYHRYKWLHSSLLACREVPVILRIVGWRGFLRSTASQLTVSSEPLAVG